ncbi:PROBABLE PROLINE AND GLYCINE RICH TRANSMEMBRANE PROTEIN [hydrothermal vent metagenome]|uniref:PROBABLE PROLINE AND GLYCINE RICH TRANSMEMBRANE PROTEIN n=1 Tax=hydrothermal vent metagenome TaxID=652676 RepID=A0A3B0X112_9ZZZZ
MSNFYQPPESDLSKESLPDGEYGSIEKAISGNYEFSIGDVLSEAWEKTSGFKGTSLLALLFYALVLIGASMAMGMLVSIILNPAIMDPSLAMIVPFLVQMGVSLIAMPVVMGMLILGMKRSVDAPVSATSVFSYFSRMLPLFATMVLVYFMVFIGMMLLVLPGIYLMVAYYMAMPLVAEKGMSPWQAMEASRKAVTHNWFSIFFLFIILSMIMFLGMITVIGWIWTIPMVTVAFGILYRNMFGLAPETLA